MDDAGWFYSSLAQVTAALVAFLGGFLPLRHQDYERRWLDILVRLKSGQARWTWEQQNQSDASYMRMGMRWFTRLTNGFSKKIENHAAAVALHFQFYNLARVHKGLKNPYPRTPAMAGASRITSGA